MVDVGREEAHVPVADVLHRPTALLLPTPQQRVDDLEQEVFQEVGVLLEHPRRDQQLPLTAAAVLDAVQQVRLARPLVAEHRNHLRVRAWVAAVEIDDREQL